MAFLDGLDGWLSVSRHVTIYDYGRHSQMKSLPFIVPRRFVQDIGCLSRRKVEGFLCQANGVWGIYGINYFAAARAMWDANVNADAMLARFYTDFYGPAAPQMKLFYETLETALRKHECINLEGERALHAYLTPELLATAGRYLQQAKAAAKSGPEQQRVDMAAQCFEYGRLFATAERAREAYVKTRDKVQLQAAAANFEEMTALLTKQGRGPYLVGDSPRSMIEPVIRKLRAELKATAP